ncbi:MAG: DUF924 domain-containing protein [Gammaproteobacteria bacterium]|nr:DUF924 domain-containing protein [Gammaproteobacteria bacterium]
MSNAADEILRFWFGEQEDDADIAKAQKSIWWSKNQDVDREISESYRAKLEEACNGDLADWENSGRGMLALIILVDQFSRNIYRDDARSFANDHLARDWCRQMLARRLDMELRPIERVFAYFPLEHSEDMADQDQCVALFATLREQASDRHKDLLNGFLGFANAHRDIIVRFGRYPHRNKILARESTDDEKIFLTQPESSF